MINLDLVELWQEKVFNLSVFVLHVLASAGFTGIIVICTGFPFCEHKFVMLQLYLNIVQQSLQLACILSKFLSIQKPNLFSNLHSTDS